ncbi:MAG: hypothetical protein KAY37_12965 [Phycisphaerae bacterium]|nr:hypothetical protein [Phycisphaerae bacterium]
MTALNAHFWIAFVLLGLMSICAQPVLGQDSRPTPAGMPTVSYTEPAFGFEMQVPAGWSYDRSRFQQFKNSIGLMRGRSAGGQQGLQILVFRVQPIVVPDGEDEHPSMRLPSFEDWVIDFGKAVAESANAERLEWETWKLPPRAGALLTYASKIGATRTRTHCLCVPFDPSTVWVFVYSGTIADEAEQRRLRQDFEQLIGTLHVHYDPGEAEQLTTAFERGRTLIEKLHQQASRVRLDETEHYYEITIGRRAIGYLSRRASREEYEFTNRGAEHRDVREGLRIRERSWRFADDGTIRHTRLDMFTSFDMQNELIENQLTQVPAPDVEPQELLIKTDRVIRKDDVLFSSFTTSLDRTLPDPGKPLGVGPVYLDLAWVRLLPGLLYTAPREPHAFAIYNTETRSLSSQIITFLGERELAGHAGKAYAFEVREGLIDRPALLYADQHGNLLRLVAGDLVVRRSSRDKVERAFGPRRDDARQRFKMTDE